MNAFGLYEGKEYIARIFPDPSVTTTAPWRPSGRFTPVEVVIFKEFTTEATFCCRLPLIVVIKFTPGTGSLTPRTRSEEHTSELQSPDHLVSRLLLEKKKTQPNTLTP